MKTIKIIDLLNKIANGEEVPKKIKYDSYIYEYSNNDKFYYDENSWSMYRDFYENGNCLNDEVEIIEDKKNKKIEKLNTSKYFYVGPFNENQPKPYDIDVFKKINEIINYINKNEEEK